MLSGLVSKRPNVGRKIFLRACSGKPCSSASGVRTVSILDAMNSIGWDVHFLSPARTHLAPKEIFDTLRVTLHKLPSFGSAETQNLFSKLKPDMIIFDRYLTEEMVLWRVRNLCRNAAIVVDTQDLHFLRQARQHILEEHEYLSGECIHMSSIQKDYYRVALKKWTSMHPEKCDTLPKNLLQLPEMDLSCLPFYELFEKYPKLKESFLRELSSLHRADYVLTTSKVELEYLVESLQLDSKKVFNVPFYYANQDIENREYNQRSGFFMLGNFRHFPNRDALRYTKLRLWPHIRCAIPNAKICVYGANPEAKDFELSNVDMGFLVKGAIRQSELYSKISKFKACIAPIRYGAGLKGKVLDSWVCGTPVIATPIAAEGMTDAPFGGLVASTDKTFIQSSIECHSNSDLWKTCSQQGREFIKNHFSKHANLSKLQCALMSFIENLSEIRSRNNVGSMLWMSKEYQIDIQNQLKKLKSKQ